MVNKGGTYGRVELPIIPDTSIRKGRSIDEITTFFGSPRWCPPGALTCTCFLLFAPLTDGVWHRCRAKKIMPTFIACTTPRYHLTILILPTSRYQSPVVTMRTEKRKTLFQRCRPFSESAVTGKYKQRIYLSKQTM